MHYGFAIDQQRCIGCHTCSVACKIENNLPDEMWWNRILTDGGAEMDIPAGEFPNSTIEYVPHVRRRLPLHRRALLQLGGAPVHAGHGSGR